MQYYEDIEVGAVHELGSTSVTREEILEFAEKYDPQPFHLDDEAAEETIFGGLIASGWQTAGLVMRLLVDEHLNDYASMGARGVDELRWRAPVHPGDTLTAELEFLEKRPSESNPRIGHVESRISARNGDDEEVISWVGLAMYERRDHAEDA
ncbi:MaoC family dehydratase [Halomarina litorea]|uniref:MaoC family dehydratase n=1 Tax=Halomarina litorea TaxID=2961595 RepID=UPI0020C5A3EB|nr:MaoC family dehydratase [Halomarina sp. BCD28]